MKLYHRNFRKWAIVLTLCLVSLIFVLVGCSSPSTSQPTTAPTATQAKPAATQTAAPAKTWNLKFTHLLGSQGAGVDLSLKLCDDVEKATNGAVKIKVYFAGEIAQPKDVPEMVRQGSIDMGAFPAGDYPALFPINEQIQSYTTLTQDPRIAHDYWFGLLGKVPEVSAEFNKMNMQFLARNWVSNKYMQTKKPLRTLADVKGLQLRVMGGQYLADVVSALGATRVAVPLAEAYESFMRGSIDGVQLGMDLLYTQKYYEVGKYVGMPFGCEPFWMQVINLDVWKSFTPEIQQAFIKASASFDDAALKAVMETDAKYKPMIEKQGVQFIEFSQSDWNAAIAKAGDQMTYLKATMDKRGLSDVGNRMATIWPQLIKEAQTKYGTK
jgi:TRAP-type transport system periplasmic protein